MAHQRPAAPARVAVVGGHGFGRWHLANVHRLAQAGLVELAGVCDPQPPSREVDELVGDAPWVSDLDELLSTARPEITIVVTPIHTHVDLAVAAAAARSHLLLEKPPAPSTAEFERLAAAVGRAGVACQVGFQRLGSGAVAGIRSLLADGVLGELRGIGGVGVAVRDAAYYGRASWAGRRRLDGMDVVDGVLTNPYLHAVAAAIRLADAERPRAIAGTELELHRGNPIEADDTSVARLFTTTGVTITVAATLCATEEVEPELIVHGSRGRATWGYKRDEVRLDVDGEVRTLQFDRADLLENLIAHLRDASEALIAPLQSTRAVSEFVDAVRRAPDPVEIPAEARRTEGEGAAQHVVVAGAGDAVRRAAAELAMFSELQVPWAAPAAGQSRVELEVGGRGVATYELAPDVEKTLSPRPFLHPVRTLAGTVVSDREPDDHRWHLGVGVAIQDVDGVNVWGGRTYVRGRGYEWRDDHGTVRHLRWVWRTAGELEQELAWMSPDHRCLLVERRTIAATPSDAAADRWILGFGFELRNVTGAALELGSPGSNGREGGGYGGFFWRLPRSAAPSELETASNRGEEQVHGTIAPWLAWRGDAGDPGTEFTIVVAPDDEVTARDPWFVRCAGYPGIGSALAWDRPVVLGPGDVATRSFRAVIADGAGHDPAALHGELQQLVEAS